MMAPVVGSLVLVAGAVVIGVGVAALPLYGGLRIIRLYRHHRRVKSNVIAKSQVKNVDQISDE